MTEPEHARRVEQSDRRVTVDRRIQDMTPGRRAQVRRATDSIGRGTAPAPRVPLNNLPGDGRERKS